MNRSNLFEEVKSWLEAEELAFLADSEEANFQVRMNLENGLVQVRIVCEKSPATLQVITAIPVKVPKKKITAAGLLLHNLNLRLRIGAFQFLIEERLITFRLTFPIRSECDLPKQFGEAFGTALSTMDDHLQPLALFCCSTDQAQAAVAKLTPGDECLGANSRLPAGRLELN